MTDRQTDRQTRNVYLDIVKFFTIFLVIWGHVVQQTSNVSCWPVQEDSVVRLIYTMHMPLFMGLCGYFFYFSIRKWPSVHAYVLQKLPSRLAGLIIPMISFGLIKIACDVFWNTPIPHATFPFLKYWYSSAKGIWFLGDVAVNTVIVLLILYFCNGNFRHDWKYFILAAVLSMVPYVSYKSPHMYFFFVAGYCLAAYVKSDFRSYIKYWKWVLVLFVASYIAFSNMPWPPEDFWYDYHHQSILRLAVNDGLKMILGITGSYLALVLMYKLLPYIKRTPLYHLAAREGQYTLDIYLVQIIIIEKLLGPFYKLLVSQSGVNWMNEYGLFIKIVSTLLLAAILLGFVIGISNLCNKNHYVSKMLFWRG